MQFFLTRLRFVLVALASLCLCRAADFPWNAGFIYDQFPLTLEKGERTEIAGPLFHREESEGGRIWAFSPLISKRRDTTPDLTEIELLYPAVTFDRFGSEYRLQILQWFAFSGGKSGSGGEDDRITIFPFYFQQRSKAHPERNYTALVPIYGTLKNRFFRDYVRFIMLPLYVQSRKRDVVTDNYLYPVFHLRRGNGLKGWQVWPLVGNEVKVPTQATNNWNEVAVVPGHRKFFALWPILFKTRAGIGSTNEVNQLAVLPFYARQRSPARDSTTYGFPIGFTHTIDRERKYEEWDAPWPLIVYARGEGKTTRRIWPFFSMAKTPTLRSDFFLWPIYKFNAVTAPPLDRRRTRILLFLYSDLIERDTVRNNEFRRRDLWPLYTYRQERNGNSRLQVLAPLEPILPNNKSIERLYSPLWSVWRAEKNATTGARSESLLWNLYRRERGPDRAKVSALFGLFQYERTAAAKRWRLFYIPIGGKKAAGSDLPDR